MVHNLATNNTPAPHTFTHYPLKGPAGPHGDKHPLSVDYWLNQALPTFPLDTKQEEKEGRGKTIVLAKF